MIIRFILFALLSFALFAQQDVNNKILLAQAYEQGGDYKKATAIYEELLNSNPTNFQFFQGLLRCYQQTKDFENAINLIESRLKLFPSDLNLIGQLGVAWYQSGNEQKAFDIWDNTLKTLPQTYFNYRLFSNFAIEIRAFDKAIEYLIAAKKFETDQIPVMFDIANLYSITMQYANATKEYCEILLKDSKQFYNVQSRFISYLNRPEAVEQSITILNTYNKKLDEAIILLALCYIEQKEYEKAFEQYKKYNSDNLNKYELLYGYGNRLLDKKEFNVAAQVFKYIKEIDSKQHGFDWQLDYNYANALRGAFINKINNTNPTWKPICIFENYFTEELEQVVQSYSPILSKYKFSEVSFEAEVKIGELYLQYSKSEEKAESYFKNVIERAPLYIQSADALYGLAQLKLQQGKINECLELINQAIKHPRTTTEKINSAKLLRAKILFYIGDYSSAYQNLSEINLDLKDNTTNDILEFMTLITSSMKDSVAISLYAEGLFFIEQKIYEEAKDRFQQVSAKAQSFILKEAALLQLLQIALAKKEFTVVETFSEQITSNTELSVYGDDALFLQGMMYEFDLRDLRKALEVYTNFIVKYPNSLFFDTVREKILLIKNKIS